MKQTQEIGNKFTVFFVLAFFSIVRSQCPESTNTLHRIGNTRYYIIQNTKQRGDFVTIEQARKDCSKHGLKLATVKNLVSLAVLGRPLEKMAFKERMKDTWYWLDAKYDVKSEKYYWENDVNDELKYTVILYRTPRPIGVNSHITYNNVYQKDQDKPQCLTLALPWLGSADHHINTTVFFGHQTSFDERDCKSQKKRHAMCEASKTDCQSTESNPYVLDEEKTNYFEDGNWIFGDRKYIINWKQKNFNDSERYCKSLGLQLMNAGDLEKILIPHIKMWSREITVSQFWTGMSYHDETKQYMDSSGNIIADSNTESNFTESEFQGRSSKTSPIFCVALSLAYEFKSQMPCSNPNGTGCQWSFIRYAPANCNNYHGTICQHADYDKRKVKWYPNFKTNLDDVLEKTALTTAFGYKGNNFILRSKYKQTFGTCYCPKGYRMIRSHKHKNLAWSMKLVNTTGKEIYEYDYMESYWMVDEDLFNKDVNSRCTLTYPDKEIRKFKEIKCTEWYFYLCERLGKRPTKPSRIIVNKAPPMKWEEGPQPRVYPLVSKIPPTVYESLCPCKLDNDGNEWNAVTNQCVKRIKECPKNVFDPIHCQRGGSHVFYSIGGVICNSPNKNDRCDLEKQIFAYCYRTETVKDTKGITYVYDKDIVQKWNVPNHLWQGRWLDYSVKSIPTRDDAIYRSSQMGVFENITAGIPNEKDACATRSFEITGDGRYEISIKFADYKYKDASVVSKYKRAFNVLLNDIYIAREFNPNDYLPIRHGMELNANVWVFGKGKMLELQGHPIKALLVQEFKLEICYSFCARTGYKADPNWMMTAVSIIKFPNKLDDPCECKLKNSMKEYDTVLNKCVDILHNGLCPQEEFVRKQICQRHGDHVFYAIRGTVCNSKAFNNYCKLGKIIYAVNFNGELHNDSRGIYHSRASRADWVVQRSVWVEYGSKYNAENVPESDKLIYRSFVSGEWVSINKTRSAAVGCAVLLFPTDGDGIYEITMKTGELWWTKNENQSRTFSVMLNDMFIVKEFVLERYRQSPLGMELVANFRILENSKMIELQGHPSVQIPRSDKKLQLEFCHSNCNDKKVGYWVDRNWIMHGLSILKFDVTL